MAESKLVMEYRHLGKSGLKVSALSLGTWINFTDQNDEELVFQCFKAAYEAGINFFDTAEIYGFGKGEEMLGKAIKKLNCKRSDLVISTKLIKSGPKPNDQGLSMKHIIEGLETSLERLQLRYVDLLYCHRPDPTTPLVETVRAMTYLIQSGKVFYWGTSNWPSYLIQEAHHVAKEYHLIPPTMEQPQYNMFEREKVENQYMPMYQLFGLG
jgi:voltage-dependent potassium channel beta subunit